MARVEEAMLVIGVFLEGFGNGGRGWGFFEVMVVSDGRVGVICGFALRKHSLLPYSNDDRSNIVTQERIFSLNYLSNMI